MTRLLSNFVMGSAKEKKFMFSGLRRPLLTVMIERALRKVYTQKLFYLEVSLLLLQIV